MMMQNKVLIKIQIFLILVNQKTSSTPAEYEALSLDNAMQVFIPHIKVKTKTKFKIQSRKSKIGFRKVHMVAYLQYNKISYTVVTVMFAHWTRRY